MESKPISAIVLAGQRLNEQTEKNNFGPFTKINQRYAIEYVINTLDSTDEISRVSVVTDKYNQNMMPTDIRKDASIKFIEPESGPSLSVKKALNGLQKPCLVTTGDHPLLTADTVKIFLKKSIKEKADITIGLVPHKLLIDNNISSKRTLYKFQDGSFCGCNLFLFKTNHANHVFDIWNKVELSRKKPWRIIYFFGLTYLVLYLLGVMKSKDAEIFLSKKIGLKIKFVEVTCFKAAIDLDSEKDYPLIRKLLGVN